MPKWVEKVALAICREWDLKYRDGSGYVYIEEIKEKIWNEYKNAQQSVHPMRGRRRKNRTVSRAPRG